MSIHDMTRQFLLNAFAGESMAHMRYLIFSEIAEKDGFPNVARLFKAIAFAEQVHARNHYNNLREYDADFDVSAGTPAGPGHTLKNLEEAARGEEFEVSEMYPVYLEAARFQGEKNAERSFHFALEAEKIHAKLFREAQSVVEQGKDMQIQGKVWICPVCGHTYIGEEPPEKCPICGASQKSYVGF
ncbi:MAG: rubrerythrin family protein [Infirmifilum sp.]